MKIEDYAPYFHDGELISIIHSNDKIELSLESFMLDFELGTDIFPSERRTLRGKLHLNKIKTITRDNVVINNLKFNWDSCEILDLVITFNRVYLLVSWSNYPPKVRETRTEEIEIIAEQIYWENIPNLFVPESGEEMLDINFYFKYFKNGKFICFENKNDIIKFSIESHFITSEELKEIYTYYNAIRGKLMMKGLKYSKKNGQDFQCPKEEFRSGKILNFEIENTKVSMKVQWQDSSETDYFEFEAGEIFFLSIPLLYDPFES